ncbi:hypothetical protein [Dyella sp.]
MAVLMCFMVAPLDEVDRLVRLSAASAAFFVVRRPCHEDKDLWEHSASALSTLFRAYLSAIAVSGDVDVRFAMDGQRKADALPARDACLASYDASRAGLDG